MTPMTTLADLGEALAQRRKDLGKTQTALAHEIGLRQEELSRLENAHLSGFTVAKLLRVARALGLEVSLTPRTGVRPTLETLLVERRNGVNTGPGKP
jgi:HTH-type transcriptional regulator / antitoxin HipB